MLGTHRTEPGSPSDRVLGALRKLTGVMPKPKLKRMPRRARRGMVNVVLTLAIVAIALGILVALFIRSNNSLRTQTTQTTVTAFEAEIRRSYANAPQYTAEDYDTIFAARMPTNALRNGNIVTAWGGDIDASGGTVPGTATAQNNRFWITLADLPEAACVAIAESFLDRTDVLNVHTVNAAATAFATGTVRTTRAAIQTNCGGAGVNKVGIVFRG